jgi:transposase
MDETTVHVMGEEDRKDTRKSYMRLARGGPPEKPVVIFKYSDLRKAENREEFTAGFCGYLQTDGCAGYDRAVKGREDIIHAGCFAHARRKFFEAQKNEVHARSAAIGIQYIKQLYDIDNELREELKKNELPNIEPLPSLFLKTSFLRITGNLKSFKYTGIGSSSGVSLRSILIN